MNIITTTIRIDKDVRDYSKIRAQKRGMSFMAHYEDLLLKDLKENEPEMYNQYYSGKTVSNRGKTQKRSLLARIYDPNKEAINENGEIINGLGKEETF